MYQRLAMPVLPTLLVTALLLPVATAVVCPPGMFHIKTAEDRRLAMDSGRHAFKWHPKDFCSDLPLFISEPLYFGLRMRALCTDEARTRFVVAVSFKSPCSGGQRKQVRAAVNWNPRECHPDYWPNRATTKVIFEVDQMRALQCPPGFQRGEVQVVGHVLDVSFLQHLMPTLRGTDFWCKGGMSQVVYHGFNGCTAGGDDGAEPYIMAAGKASYTCLGTNEVKELGFSAEGTYRETCFDKVTVVAL